MAVGKKDSKFPKANKGRTGLRKGQEVFDATPEEDGADISHDGKSAGKPHDIRDSKAWKKGESGLKKVLTNYFDFLRKSFNRMGRAEQLQTIQKFCMAFTIGIAAVILCCFYSVLPMALRVLSLPLFGGFAWWLATKVIAPTVIQRLSKYIHPREFDDED